MSDVVTAEGTLMKPDNTKLRSFLEKTLPSGEVQTYESASFRNFFSVSSYDGPLIHPLRPHSFGYDGHKGNVNILGYEEYIPNPFTGRVYTTTWKGPGLSFSSPDLQLIVSGDEIECVRVQALDKLNALVRGDLDLSIDAAEWKSTARMFNSADRVVSMARVFQGKYRTAKTIANAWLEFTYGMKPLLGTVYGAATEIKNLGIKPPSHFKAGARQVLQNRRVNFTDCFGTGSSVKTIGEGKIACHYGVNLRPSGLSSLSRWTSLNPASIAWELMPYSFVADWFIDIGGYLRNVETALINSDNFVDGYVTNIVAYDGKIRDVRRNDNWPFGYDFFQYSGSVRFRKLNRQVIYSYPAPRFPSFKANLGSSRLLSAGALLSTLLPRR